MKMSRKIGCMFCNYIEENDKPVMGNDYNVAIVPQNPVTEGHLIVIPREHVEGLLEDPEVTSKMTGTAILWAGLLGETNDLYSSVSLVASVGEDSEDEEHLHLHIVPRSEGDGIQLPGSGAELER